MWRTGRTTLSDDALLLCDALFDGGGYVYALWDEEAAERQTILDAPSPDITALQDVLQTMLTAGLVQRYYAPYDAEGYRQHVRLAPAGGELWQKERLPDWNRYCYAMTYQDDTRRMWSVDSPSLDTARAYLDTAYHLGMGAPPPESVQQMAIPQHRLLPWKDFPMIYRLYGLQGASTFDATDDAPAYYDRLQWWRNVPELVRLHQQA
jgi:hypothetical protein